MKLAGQLSNSVNNSSYLKCESIDSIRVRNYIKMEVTFFFSIFKSVHDVEKELVSMRGIDACDFFL